MKFCPACGAAQQAMTQQDPGRFCHECGVSLSACAPPTGLPALQAARPTTNVPAFAIGRVAIPLIVGGTSFLLLR